MPVTPVVQNVKLEYGTPQHDRIRNLLRASLDKTESDLSSWHEKIRFNEGQQQLWIKKPDGEGGNDTARNTDAHGRGQMETILIPYAYATTAAAHMYASSVFLGRSPIFQFTGRHGETQMQEMLMEAIINYQVVGGVMRPEFFHWLYDPFRYGAGVVGCYWDKEVFPVSEIVEMPAPFTGKPEKQMVTIPTMGYQGNKIYNVRLLDFIWDTKVGLADFQKGDFAGERIFFQWNKIVEMHAKGLISDRNMEVLRRQALASKADDRIVGNSQFESITDDEWDTMTENSKFVGTSKSGLTIAEMTRTIVPKAWGLSDSPWPEKWQFGLAGKEVVVWARPAGAQHNKYPYAVLTYEIDKFAKFPRSLATFADMIERTMSWLFNTHMYNVRKHLNNNLIVDPSRVVMKDFYARTPGSPIRLKSSQFGSGGIKDAVHQLSVGDVTQQHLFEMRNLEQIGQKITGVSDNVMGAVTPGGRKTATEIRSANTFSTNRLKTVVEWFSATGVADLARQMTINTQQYLEGEEVVKILGDMIRDEQGFENFMRVTKEDIAGVYDFEVVDGSLPADRFAQANLMRELYALIIQNPVLQQQYDLASMTSYTASLLGVRNLDRFRTQVVSPEQLQQGQEAGNVAPLQSVANGP